MNFKAASEIALPATSVKLFISKLVRVCFAWNAEAMPYQLNITYSATLSLQLSFSCT
jgi:hypothetical protein